MITLQQDSDPVDRDTSIETVPIAILKRVREAIVHSERRGFVGGVVGGLDAAIEALTRPGHSLEETATELRFRAWNLDGLGDYERQSKSAFIFAANLIVLICTCGIDSCEPLAQHGDLLGSNVNSE